MEYYGRNMCVSITYIDAEDQKKLYLYTLRYAIRFENYVTGLYFRFEYCARTSTRNSTFTKNYSKIVGLHTFLGV